MEFGNNNNENGIKGRRHGNNYTRTEQKRMNEQMYNNVQPQQKERKRTCTKRTVRTEWTNDQVEKRGKRTTPYKRTPAGNVQNEWTE